MSIYSQNYFKRIGFSEIEITPNLEGLKKLHRAHITQFTFENIDCLLGVDIELSTEALYKKLIERKRGGYCFELNLFFCEALKHFGFRAEVFLARVFYRGNGINAKTHLTVIVDLEGKKYIADAGFGGPGPEGILEITPNIEQHIYHYDFKVIEDDEFGFMITRKTDGVYKNVFAFKLDKVYEADLEMSNFYVSKLETSAFRNNLNLCRFVEEGRITIFNNNLNYFLNGKHKTETINSFKELKQKISDELKLDLGQEEMKELEKVCINRLKLF